ncbi:very short patch repair endonuclease [Trinickia sp. YCB016]
MTDTLTTEQRSRVMSRVRGKDTVPELRVRKLLFAAGYRYRLHVANLPGRPDLVFPGRRKVVFVHGCFWHMHPGCVLARLPKSRGEFWLPKLRANRERDARNERDLCASGWSVLVVWECELKNIDEVLDRLAIFLGPARTATIRA